MKIDVYFYAAARELAGCSSSTFELGSQSLPQQELRRLVSDRYPPLAAYLERMRLAVNGDFVDGSHSLIRREIGSTFFRRLRAALRSFFAKSATRRFHSTRFVGRSSTPVPEAFVSSTASSATTPTASKSHDSTTKHTRAWRRKK